MILGKEIFRNFNRLFAYVLLTRKSTAVKWDT